MNGSVAARVATGLRQDSTIFKLVARAEVPTAVDELLSLTLQERKNGSKWPICTETQTFFRRILPNYP
jgi:hypothetical protein